MDYDLFKQRLRDNTFTEDEILIIVSELENICHHCFDGDKSCQCWNDE